MSDLECFVAFISFANESKEIGVHSLLKAVWHDLITSR